MSLMVRLPSRRLFFAFHRSTFYTESMRFCQHPVFRRKAHHPQPAVCIYVQTAESASTPAAHPAPSVFAGFSARQRKDEVERLNDQLRKINLSLRQQAKAGTIYAPGLTYAPSPTFKKSEGGAFTIVDQQQQELQEQQSVPTPAQKVSAVRTHPQWAFSFSILLSILFWWEVQMRR